MPASSVETSAAASVLNDAREEKEFASGAADEGTAEHSPASPPPPRPSAGPSQHTGLVGFVDFDKTGSSTLRSVLAARGIAHGWRKPEGDTGVCHALHHGVGHPSRYAEGLAPGGPPRCYGAHEGSVVQTEYGFCGLLTKYTQRQCRYFTLLREPRSRLVSAWNYFCLQCHEGGRQCVKDKDVRTAASAYNHGLPRDSLGVPSAAPRNSCPHMSVTDYAALSSNIYVAMFGVPERHIANASSLAAELARVRARGRWPRPGAVELPVAREALRRPAMLVLSYADRLVLGARTGLRRSRAYRRRRAACPAASRRHGLAVRVPSSAVLRPYRMYRAPGLAQVLHTEELSSGGLGTLWRSLNESMRVPTVPKKNSNEHTAAPTDAEARALTAILKPDIDLYEDTRRASSARRRLRATVGHAPPVLRWPDGFVLSLDRLQD
jgi:hypothetical protein